MSEAVMRLQDYDTETRFSATVVSSERITSKESPEEVRSAAEFMLSNRMVSPQTGAEGIAVKRLLVAAATRHSASTHRVTSR